jgi:hypothetical protein
VKKAILGLAMLAATAPPAARAQPLTWQPFAYSSNLLSPLDTPGDPYPTYNTTGCVWNDQDERTDSGAGDLNAGQTADHAMCMIGDYDDGFSPEYPKVALYRVYAPRATLTTTLTNDAGTTWPSPAPVDAGNQVMWELCAPDPVADAVNAQWQTLPSYWPLVPRTTGYGQLVTYTLRITATTRTHGVITYMEVAHSSNLPPRTLPVACPPGDGV